MTTTTVKCATCDISLDSKSSADSCPSCQAGHQMVEIVTTDTLNLPFKELVRVKWKTDREVYRITVGDSLYRKTAGWNFIRQVVDEPGDLYEKLIVNPRTGAVLRWERKRLRDHRGHGSAKKPHDRETGGRV